MRRTIARLLVVMIFVNIAIPFSAAYAAGETLESSSISILSNIDGGLLYIDGKDTGLLTPITEPVVTEPGFHRLRIEKEGYTTWRQQLLLSPGETMTATAVLLPIDVTESQKEAFKGLGKKPITKTWWFWTIVLAGIGAAIASDDAGGSGSDGGTVRVEW